MSIVAPDSMRDFGRSSIHAPSYVFGKIDTLPINLFNSIYVTAATVVLTTVCAVLAGYALVHMRARGVGVVIAILLISLYLPIRVVSIISIYEIQSFLDLINSTSGLILPYVTLNLAISVLIMRSMFQLIPHAMIEAAKMDGAGHWRILWSIGLPMVRNGLGVIFIVNFVTAWGEFLLCSTLTNDQEARTMPVVLAGPRRAWPVDGRHSPQSRHVVAPASSPSPSPRSSFRASRRPSG
jgi:ABC-type glycerol-3-phosphate transport system permease component